MNEERAVTTAHIDNALWLLLNRLIKEVNNNLVHHLKISRMCAAAAPDIHRSIHVDFFRALGQIPENRWIAKEQFFYFRNIGI